MLAAWSLFAEKGYEGTSIGDVAAEAGIAVGTVYHHFTDKRALLLQLLERFEAAPLVQEPDSPGGGIGIVLQEDDVPAAALALCKVAVTLRAQKPSLYSIARELGRGDTELAECCDSIARGHAERLRYDLEAGQRLGKVRADIDPESAAPLLQTILRDSLEAISASPESMRDARTRELASMLCRYVLAD